MSSQTYKLKKSKRIFPSRKSRPSEKTCSCHTLCKIRQNAFERAEWALKKKRLKISMPEKDLIITAILLLICVALFISGKIRPDFVAVMALAGISLSGVLTFREALSGFAEPTILMIALMFVISEAFSRTGISYRTGEWIYRKSGKNVPWAMVLLMMSVAVLGSVMSTTAIIAIFLPITLSLCRRLKISPSKLLMPLAFAGIISGMMTLVATSPNMIINAVLENSGNEPFGFFSITPLGLIVLAMGVLYMLYVHRFLGNSKEPKAAVKARKNLEDYIRDYRLGGRGCVFRVKSGSPVAGKTMRDAGIRSKYSANIVCIERAEGKKSSLINPLPETEIREGDAMYADMAQKPPMRLLMETELGLEMEALQNKRFLDKSMQMGMAEISVIPESEYIGRTLAGVNFRKVFGLHAVGLRRNGRPVGGDIAHLKLKVGDLLLVVGPRKTIRRLFSNEIGFAVISMPAELSDTASAPDKAPYAILSMAFMIVLTAFNIVPGALAALLACIAMVLAGCISVEAAYKSIKLPTVTLIACMMPFAAALEKTGAVKMAAEWLFALCGGGGPHAVLAGVFALTIFISIFMSNIVTTILIAPVAVSAADMLGVSPLPFAMGVAIAASTAFASPLSTAVNLMVWEPGRYTFGDFVRIGLPFSLLVMAVCVAIIPIFFPFYPVV